MALSQSRTSRRQRQTVQQPTAFSVEAVKPYLLDFYWPYAEPYIRSALEHGTGEMLPEDVLEQLRCGRQYLFIGRHKTICGAATAEVIQYPRKKVIRVVTLGGDAFDGWRRMLHEKLVEWMQLIRADGIEACVRAGGVPDMRAFGYREVYHWMWLDGTIIRRNDN